MVWLQNDPAYCCLTGSDLACNTTDTLRLPILYWFHVFWPTTFDRQTFHRPTFDRQHLTDNIWPTTFDRQHLTDNIFHRPTLELHNKDLSFGRQLICRQVSFYTVCVNQISVGQIVFDEKTRSLCINFCKLLVQLSITVFGVVYNFFFELYLIWSSRDHRTVTEVLSIETVSQQQ